MSHSPKVRCAVAASVFMATLFLAGALCCRSRTPSHEPVPGAGQPKPSRGTSPGDRLSERAAGGFLRTAEAGTSLSPDRENPEEQQAPGYDVGAQAPSMIALLADLDPDFMPTAEGLFARTGQLWAQPDFLNLSVSEAAAIVPPIDDLDVTYPGTILEYLGSDLPTLEDCKRAMQDAEASTLFEVLVYRDVCASEMQGRRLDSPARKERLRVTRQQRDEAEIRLAERLDKIPGFHNWTVLTRLYADWRE